MAGPQPSSQIKCQRTVRAAWSSSYPSAPVLRARRRLLRRCMRRISASQAASSTEEQCVSPPSVFRVLRAAAGLSNGGGVASRVLTYSQAVRTLWQAEDLADAQRCGGDSAASAG